MGLGEGLGLKGLEGAKDLGGVRHFRSGLGARRGLGVSGLGLERGWGS